MGTIINSVCTVKPFFRKAIVYQAGKAARRCLKKASICDNQVGMLINTGMFTENYIGEPALAALIQKEILKKWNFKKNPEKISQKTFSFDLHNGGGGVIQAIEVIDGFIQSDKIRYGLVVAGDIKPRKGFLKNYNFRSLVGVVLLSKEIGNCGFSVFRTYSYPQFLNDFQIVTGWGNGRFELLVKQNENYLSNCVESTMKSLANFCDEYNLNINDIDLIVTSQSPSGYVEEIKKKPGLSHKIVVLKNQGEIYSAGLFFALDKIYSNHIFNSSKNILFVTAGSGITISIALYKNCT
jgi:3-oxoacyl-[acyl-carrier-protein] synthase III